MAGFYGSLGWGLDADRSAGDSFRIVQLTPAGSGCSIQFGAGVTSAAPGSARDVYLTRSRIEAACDELVARGHRWPTMPELFPATGMLLLMPIATDPARRRADPVSLSDSSQHHRPRGPWSWPWVHPRPASEHQRAI